MRPLLAFMLLGAGRARLPPLTDRWDNTGGSWYESAAAPIGRTASLSERGKRLSWRSGSPARDTPTEQTKIGSAPRGDGGSGSMLDDLLQRRTYNAVTDFVDAPVARGLSEKVAFIDADRSLTYGELKARTCRFATALKNLGVRPEERLAVLLYDTVDFPVAFWGGVRAGIVVLPLNTLLTPEQYAYILNDSRASAIVAAAPLAKTLLRILDRLPHLRTI